MSIHNLSDWTIADIVLACRQESQQPRKEEKGHCFELFRRALDTHDELAWSALQEQYEGLIRGWLYATSVVPVSPQVIEDLLQETWMRFWRTLSQQSLSLDERFEHVGGLLNYLQRCVVIGRA